MNSLPDPTIPDAVRRQAGNRRPALSCLTAGLLAGGISLFAWAQSPPPASSVDPAALTALRQRYQTLLSEAGKPSLSRWLTALGSLEKQRVATGDFDGAARVRGKISALRGSTPAGSGQSAAAAGRPSIFLRPGQARTTPGVEFTDAAKETLRFKKTGGSLEWELSSVIPGIYDVRLTFGVFGPGDQNDLPDPMVTPPAGSPDPVPGNGAPPLPVPLRSDAGGGALEFRRISNFGAGASVLRRTIRPTGGWATYRTLSLGTMDFDSRLAKLSLRAVDCLPMGLMDFRSIELVPAAAPGSAGYPKDLARLKEVYQKQFTEYTRPVNAKYLKSLTDLEAQMALTKDTDTLALIRQEKKRLDRGGDDTQQAPMTFQLPVNDSLVATIRGEARLTSQKDFLIRLRPAGGCEIIWKLTRLGIPPGQYKVQIDCRLTAETGGTASLFSMAGGGTPDPALTITIPPAGEPVPLTSFNPGTVTIGKGSDHLFLRVTSLEKSDGSLCDLKSLRLTPVTAP
ncbi:MAG: hypothetical protein V4726_23155 [Verrucomicrobiota bacterium]